MISYTTSPYQIGGVLQGNDPTTLQTTLISLIISILRPVFLRLTCTLDDHKVDMQTGCTFNHRYVNSNPREVENATWMLTVFHCSGQYFCLHFEAFQLGMTPVYMAFLRFMGAENDARTYTYSLKVGEKGGKLNWEGTPQSIRDSHRKFWDSHDTIII